jgi:hypothetical protein
MCTSTFSSSLRYASLFYVFLLRFMLCVLFPFYVLCLFCVFHLLHTTCFCSHESLSIAAHISSLFCVFILSVHLLHSLMCNASASSLQRHCSSLQVVHCSSSSLLHSSTTESLHLSVLHAFLTSSHLLIIMETLHLLWRLAPCVHHHWALC